MRAFPRFITCTIIIEISLSCFIAPVRAWSPQSSIDDSPRRRDFLKTAAKGAVVASTVGWTSPQNGAAWAADEQTGMTGSIPREKENKSKVKSDSKIFSPARGSLVGQVHVITGSSTGLGLESAKRLAAGGATVVCTVRTSSKGEKTLQEIRDYLGHRGIENRNVFYVTLDLDDLENVRTFPDRYKKLMGNKKITVLMNNAGVAAIPQRELTRNGFERTFQSNHLGPFLLTAVLFPYLDRDGAAGVKIINVSSHAHRLAGGQRQGLDMGNLNGELEYTLDGWGAYSNSKLENILFSQELQRKANAAGLDWLTVTSLHPGVVGTDIWRNTYLGRTPNNNNASSGETTQTKRYFFSSLQGIASSAFYGSTLTIEEGANTQVWLAAADASASIQKGGFYDEHRKLEALQDFARDETKAKELWEVSERFSGTRFRLD